MAMAASISFQVYMCATQVLRCVSNMTRALCTPVSNPVTSQKSPVAALDRSAVCRCSSRCTSIWPCCCKSAACRSSNSTLSSALARRNPFFWQQYVAVESNRNSWRKLQAPSGPAPQAVSTLQRCSSSCGWSMRSQSLCCTCTAGQVPEQRCCETAWCSRCVQGGVFHCRGAPVVSNSGAHHSVDVNVVHQPPVSSPVRPRVLEAGRLSCFLPSCSASLL